MNFVVGNRWRSIPWLFSFPHSCSICLNPFSMCLWRLTFFVTFISSPFCAADGRYCVDNSDADSSDLTMTESSSNCTFIIKLCFFSSFSWCGGNFNESSLDSCVLVNVLFKLFDVGKNFWSSVFKLDNDFVTFLNPKDDDDDNKGNAPLDLRWGIVNGKFDEIGKGSDAVATRC